MRFASGIMGLFGTSGIRGVFGTDITPQLAFKVGIALGAKSSGERTLFVGNDHRLTSPLLSLCLQAGALSQGSRVKDLGLCPTPVVAWNAKAFGGDASAIITASHNPPEYNGIKLHDRTGAGFGSEESRKLEERLDHPPEYRQWDGVGESTAHAGATPFIKTVAQELGTTHDLKVVVDCNHGSAGTSSPYLLSAIGCGVTRLNAEPDGTWRSNKTYDDPRIGDWGSIADIQQAIDAVRKSGADMGVIHDGDADRVFLVTKDGPVVPDTLMAALAKLSGKDVVVSVDTSMAIEKYANVTRVPVGDVAISQALINKKDAWGGEPSGTFVWPDFSLCPDGIRSAALIASKWERIREQLEKIPCHPMKRVRIPCPEQKKQEILASLAKKAERLGKTSTIDGVRVVTESGWFLIRPSGTEPVMRVVAEAYDEKSLESLLKTAESLIRP